MKENSEPEVLVPPDMESLEIEDPTRPALKFPVKRFLIMILFSILLVIAIGMGVNAYMRTGKIGEVIPYWIFSVLLITPTACSYYFFFSFFHPRLRNPYDWDN
jgi:amino acid transporter